MLKQILIGLGALAVVALLEGLYHTAGFFAERRREELRRRLQNLGGVSESSGPSLLRHGKLSALPFLDDLLRSMPLLERLELLIDQAQVSTTVAQLIGYSALTGIGAAAVGAVLGAWSGAMLFLLIGAMVPVLVVYMIREKRSTKLSEQLPDALDMMARSMRAGHALISSFKLVASEMPSPINVEFGRAFEEQNLGMSFEKAVVQMTTRAPNNRDLKIFAVSVIVQKETGGNLVEILEKIAETIRSRYRFFGKLAGLTAEGRVSGVVLGALPLVTGLGLSIMNPDYISPLVNTPMGRSILLYAVISWALGILWLRRMAKVDF
jgi:tight adherence protein B